MNGLTTTFTSIFATASIALITSLANPAQAQDFLSDEAMDNLFTDPMMITQDAAHNIIDSAPLMTNSLDSEHTQHFLSDEEMDNLFTDPMTISADAMQTTTIAMPAVTSPYPPQIGGEIRTRSIITGEQIEYESAGGQACTQIGVIGESCS